MYCTNVNVHIVNTCTYGVNYSQIDNLKNQFPIITNILHLLGQNDKKLFFLFSFYNNYSDQSISSSSHTAVDCIQHYTCCLEWRLRGQLVMKTKAKHLQQLSNHKNMIL